MPRTGEKPGIGEYECKNCGQIVRLDDVTDTLPPCPKCENTEYTRIRQVEKTVQTTGQMTKALGVYPGGKFFICTMSNWKTYSWLL
jgi:predicted nucleic-acid-binding Zn-ribbon protein